MALTTSTIRAGIATAIRDADLGLKVWEFDTLTPDPPAAVVLFPVSITPESMYDGWIYAMQVQVAVQRVEDRHSQDILDSYLASLATTLESTFTWGSCTVTGIDGVGDVSTSTGGNVTVAVLNLTVRA